jgi:hypothetical protein
LIPGSRAEAQNGADGLPPFVISLKQLAFMVAALARLLHEDTYGPEGGPGDSWRRRAMYWLLLPPDANTGRLLADQPMPLVGYLLGVLRVSWAAITRPFASHRG